MEQQDLEAFLGRPLSATEITNLTLYVKIAENTLDRILCTYLTAKTESRVYDTRDGFRTLFIDIFNKINSIKIDGVELAETDYIIKQNDNRNGDWYNSIVFADEMIEDQTITVNADFGFVELPYDLQDLEAHIFDSISVRNSGDSRISSKKIEDFSVSYRDVTLDDQLLSDYSSVIQKYSQCYLSGSRSDGCIRHI